MEWVSILKFTGRRVDKFMSFGTEAEARAHASKFSDRYPDAFVAPAASGPAHTWSCDPVAGAVWARSPQDAEAARRSLIADYELASGDLMSALRPALVAAGHAPSRPLSAWLIADIDSRDTAALAAALGVTEAEAAAIQDDACDRLAVASTYRRGDPALDRLGALYGLVPADIDALFEEAAADG